MAWVVDTSVLIDIYTSDEIFGKASAKCLAKRLSDGLTISPVTYIELAPMFDGNGSLQGQFLAEVGIEWQSSWTQEDTRMAHKLWAEQIASKRAGHSPKRPVADVLIEAFSLRFQGLITRNPSHFKSVPVLVPKD